MVGLGGWEVLRRRKQSWKVKKRNDGDFIRFGTSKRDEVLGKWGGTNRCATARRLVVRFGDGRWANAELRGSSTVTDVAVGRGVGGVPGRAWVFWVNCAGDLGEFLMINGDLLAFYVVLFHEMVIHDDSRGIFHKFQK